MGEADSRWTGSAPIVHARPVTCVTLDSICDLIDNVVALAARVYVDNPSTHLGKLREGFLVGNRNFIRGFEINSESLKRLL